MKIEKFAGTYRIETTRLQSWDYSNDGYYFVTICTNNRLNYFGDICIGNVETSDSGVFTDTKLKPKTLGVSTEISTSIMKLSDIGKIVQNYWLEIPEHFTNVKLDEFIIMPNHIHGIIIINNANGSVVETSDSGVSTDQKWKPGTLGLIINQFKRKCTIKSRKIDPDFGWQSRFYDHIIRNEKSLYNIQNYIINNPVQWKEDDYFTK